MKPSPSKTAKTAGKKRGRDEAVGSAAGSPQPLLLKKWWPQERSRALHRLPSLQKRQRPQRRKRRRSPRLDW
jgi:hypothetical protein